MSDTDSKVIRSPSYPSLPLREAVEATRKIESTYRSNAVDRTEAAKLIGFSSLSGPANQALAALASYGFVERAGKGEIRVTARAKAVLHPHSADEKKAQLLEAGLEPQLYKELRERFADVPLPPEEGVISYLNRQNFNRSAVRPAAKAFLATMRYLEELTVSDSHGPEGNKGQTSEPPKQETKPRFGGAKVGDLIQWESDGVLRLDKAKRVRWISDDGNWLAVDESNTGIPMSQTIVQDAGEMRPPMPPAFIPPAAEPEPVSATDFRFKVGKGVVVKVTSPEELGSVELDKLIALLQAQSTALKDA